MACPVPCASANFCFTVGQSAIGSETSEGAIVPIPDDPSTVTHPFDRYTSEETIWTAADSVTRNAGDVDILGGDVTAAHGQARDGVAGMLADPMVAAEQPTADAVRAWAQSALFGGNTIRLFGDAVETYNNGVADLNRRYWAAKHDDFHIPRVHLAPSATPADWDAARSQRRSDIATADSALLRSLAVEEDALAATLDSDAATVGGLLDRGPDDPSAVVQLYAAGGLPIGTLWLFPGVHFDSVAPPLDGADGRRAAELIRKALAGDASPAEFRQAMFMLSLVGDHAAYVQEHGGTLSENEVAFLSNLYNGVGDRIWDLPGYIKDDDHGWSEDRQTALLGALGNGLLALSNPRLWDPSIRSDPMGDSRYHLPDTVAGLLIGIDPSPPTVLRFNMYGSAYPALAEMLGATDPKLQGGEEFSTLLTLRVADLAEAFSGQTHDQQHQLGDDVMRTLLEVSTRNVDADAALLSGAIDDGRHGAVTNRFLLDSLYHVDWSDGGKAATGLTSWIPEYANGTDQQRSLAASAAAHLIDLVTDTEGGTLPSPYGPRHPDVHYDGLFNSLIDGFHGGDAVGKVNPEIARNFARIADTYMADFANDKTARGTVAHGADMDIDAGDRVRFFQLVAGDESAVNALSASVNNEVNVLSRQFVETGNAPESGNAAGRLLAFFEAGVMNENLDRSTDWQEAAEASQHRRDVGVSMLITLAETGVGEVELTPGSTIGGSPFTSLGEAGMDKLFDLNKRQESEPDFDSNLTTAGGGPISQPNISYVVSRMMVEQAIADGIIPPSEAPVLPPMDTITTDGNDHAQGELDKVLTDHHVDKNSFTTDFNDAYVQTLLQYAARDGEEYKEAIQKGEAVSVQRPVS